MRRRIDVEFPHRLLAKGTTLSELGLAMINISRLLDLLTGSTMESGAGISNTVSTLNRVFSRDETALGPLDFTAALFLI